MEIKNITLKNFLAYGDYDTSFDTKDDGVSAIFGYNGKGKSTIFFSFLWAIYGRCSVSADNVVNRYVKKNCKVSVRFIASGKEYTVFRYRKHETHGNNLYIFEGDRNISLKGINETQQLIQDIIQIPYSAMVSSLMFSTENYKSFLRSKQSERLAIIESVLSLKEVSTYYTVIKDLLKITENTLQDQIKEKEKIESAIAAITENISSYKNKVKTDLEKIKKEKSDYEDKKDLLSKKYSIEIDIKKQRLLIQKYNEIINENKNIEKQISDLDLADVEGLDVKHTIVSNELASLLSIDVAKERDRIKEATGILEKNREINNEIKVLSASLSETNINRSSIISLSNEKEKIIKELESIKNSVCPLCGQDTNDKINAPIIKSKNIKLEEINLALDKSQKDIENIENENSKIRDKIKALREEIREEKVCSYTLNDIDNMVENIAIKQKEIAVLQNKMENSGKIITIINNLKNKIKEVPDVPVYSIEELDEYEHFNEKIGKIDEEIKILLAQAKNLYDKTYVEDLTSKIEKLTKAIEKSNKKIDATNDDKKHYQVLSDLFSNKEGGFKRFFIEKIIKAFNNNINKYLPLFFDKEITVEFDKELTEKILYDGFEVEFAGFSSGQKTRIDLAIAFSLFLLVKAFFSSNINIMVFDEILDQNLDAEGQSAVMSIIESLSSDVGIYIISHRDEYKDRAKNKIFIESRDGFSYIKESK